MDQLQEQELQSPLRELCLVESACAKIRILLRFRSSVIPGNPLSRHTLLMSDFCSETLGRKFDIMTDYFHMEGRIDLDDECQLVLDLNVGEPNQSLIGIPVFHYRVGYKDGKM